MAGPRGACVQVSANSDGNARTHPDFEVQCGPRQFSTVDDKTQCDILQADPYKTDAALIAKTGTSVLFQFLLSLFLSGMFAGAVDIYSI